MLDYVILATAAFLAGVLNTVAGGGTFLTFPALVYVGLPAVVANATSAVAVFPGYLGGAAGFRREIASFDRRKLGWILTATVAGGLTGSFLLLVSSDEAFAAVVPFLLALATLVFALGERLQTWAQRHQLPVDGEIGAFLVSVYGGYFNGGYRGSNAGLTMLVRNLAIDERSCDHGRARRHGNLGGDQRVPNVMSVELSRQN